MHVFSQPSRIPVRLRPFAFGAIIGLCVILAWIVISLQTEYKNKIIANVIIDGINITDMTPQQAHETLETKMNEEIQKPVSITLKVDTITTSSNSADLKLTKKYEDAITTAYELGRKGSPLEKFLDVALTYIHPLEHAVNFEYDEQEATKLIANLAKKVDIEGVEPQAKLRYSGSPASLTIIKGEIGRKVEQKKTLEQLQNKAGHEDIKLDVEVSSTSAELNEEQIKQAQERATKLVDKVIRAKAQETTLQIDDTELVTLLAFPEGYRDSAIQELFETWKQRVEREPQNATFEYDPETLKVETFEPHRDGRKINKEKTKATLIAKLQELEKGEETEETSLELSIETTPPEKTLADTNDLGINERIGFGDSYYYHSIPNRIHNVALATSRISDTIVKPGEEFQFNQTLGEVSRRTGFKSAYVISGGRTVLGDGGGVCQVSTTTFRAALNAGLQITTRLGHSYRVSYYEYNNKPGIDATVYAGDVDLRFINDTDHHILIHGETDSDNVYMFIEIYGTSDGRTTEIIDHETWGWQSPPPPQYIDDPSLPPGKTRQIDWAAAGLKAKFTNVVKDKDGNIIRERTYNTNYRPWRAVYLRGV